ncbi:MAG TPA: DUF2946 domain-containing protein [Aromatoleum sp.]|uniref:DUF2946 domain-containing protein n=1 Tax=Aromatoleum sp. TaxID=2307007 RepID=UPI002B4A6D02|nr:DUF2946 domain-containing protein [Aromatoleum sp.]HJV24254.1 DUF2946 domain-containing protein [Aromatoleum sp.]
MHLKRVPRVLTAWIALCVILFGVVAPALTHALPSGGKGAPRTIEVCTRAGMKHVAIDDAGDQHRKQLPGKQHSPADHAKHCAFCGTHGSTPVLPTARLSPVAQQASPVRAPIPASRALRLHFGWAHSQPRAPPVLS